MKKLSLLIALCMLISIGGVYAVWTYAEGDVSEATGTISDIGLAGLGADTTKGTISVTTTGTSISVDQADANYTAKLVCAGDITVTFTPSADWLTSNASVNEFDVTWALSATDTAYKVTTSDGEVKLFSSFDTSTQTLTLTKSSDGQTFTASISAETWASKMTLGVFHLTTKAAYNSCNVSGFGDITITVSEKTTT